MPATRIVTKPLGPHKYPDGLPYIDSTPDDAARSTVKLTGLAIGHEKTVNYINLNWSDGTSKSFGRRGDRVDSFVLREGEIITRVDVAEYSSNPTYICGSLWLYTNLAQEGMFGCGNTGGVHKYHAEEGITDRRAGHMGLLAFQLLSQGSIIHALRPVFAELPQITSGALKYEAITNIPKISGPQRQPAETAFTSLLRSRTVKLVVGPNRTTFNAPAATLCSLPFFHAAINGEFKEAAQCAISMPEDDVAAISALIEFLATGTYSYAFYTDPEAAKSMPRRADEALFHVGVYVVADKYDSQGLVTAAKRNFREVVKDIRGPDILRVWAVAYGAGMRVQGNWGANDVGEVDEGVVKQIKGMLDSDDKEPDRAVREIPDFGVDLLKIAVRMALKD